MTEFTRFLVSTAGKRMLLAAVLVAMVQTATPGRSEELHSYAIVQDDGTLLIRSRVVRLFGIYIPEDGRTCQTIVRPVTCGNRAAIALDLKIQGFVRCDVVQAYVDGTVSAVCRVDSSPFDPGIDLGAYLIRRGLALARPEAPFEYHAQESIARANGYGVWGFRVDAIQPDGRIPWFPHRHD